MKKSYYQPEDLSKFKNISNWSPELGAKFFEYYNTVFEEGALSAREKSLIALAVGNCQIGVVVQHSPTSGVRAAALYTSWVVLR